MLYNIVIPKTQLTGLQGALKQDLRGKLVRKELVKIPISKPGSEELLRARWPAYFVCPNVLSHSMH